MKIEMGKSLFHSWVCYLGYEKQVKKAVYIIIYSTADTQFGHEAITKICQRP